MKKIEALFDEDGIKVGTRTVVPVSVAPDQVVTDITDLELEALQRTYDESQYLFDKYLHNVFSIGLNTPFHLDQILENWLSETSSEKESIDYITEAIGTLFGYYLIDQEGMHWVFVEDEMGAEYGVKHQKLNLISFPYSSTSKSIQNNTSKFKTIAEGINHILSST